MWGARLRTRCAFSSLSLTPKRGGASFLFGERGTRNYAWPTSTLLHLFLFGICCIPKVIRKLARTWRPEAVHTACARLHGPGNPGGSFPLYIKAMFSSTNFTGNYNIQFFIWKPQFVIPHGLIWAGNRDTIYQLLPPLNRSALCLNLSHLHSTQCRALQVITPE